MTSTNSLFIEKPQTQTGNSSAEKIILPAYVGGQHAQVQTISKPAQDIQDLSLLTNKELTILKMANVVHAVPYARAKKDLTLTIPERMIWSEDEKKLFHCFLKDMALDKERIKAAEKTEFLNDFVNSTNKPLKKTPAKLAHLALFTSCFLLGTHFAQQKIDDMMPENTPVEIQNKQFVKDFVNTGVVGMGLGAISYCGLATFVFAANRIARRRLKVSRAKETQINQATQENTVLRKQIQQQLRERTKA